MERKRERTRLTLVFAGCAILAMVGVLAVAAYGKGSRVEPAAEGELSYVLDGFEIEYPYVGPSENTEPDARQAGVTYVAHWATGEYPGSVDCQMDVFGADGEQVGSLQFSVDSASEEFTRPDLPVPVSDEPATAEATCASGDYAEGAGYIYEGPSEIAPARNDRTGKPYEDRLEFTFDVRWENPDVAPEMRTCYLTVLHEGGVEQDPVRFDANIGQGRETINAYVGDPSTVETARVSCGELEPVSD